MERKRLKLRPHYGWIGGIFVVGVLVIGAVVAGVEAAPVDAAEKTIADITTMQEMTPEICAKMLVTPTGTESNVTLKDSRDGKSYRIAKLADGNCWMTQNLQLEGGTKLKTTDSDLHVGSFNPDSGTTDTFTIPASTSGGSTFSDDTKLEMNNGDATNGAYYTWCAATAGCKKVDGNNPDANEDAGSSICPKGWKLPLSGTKDNNNTIGTSAASGSFARMLGAGEFTSGNFTSMSKLTSPPYNFKNTSGRYDNGSLAYTTLGYYWSRTAISTTNAYSLDLYSSGSYMYPASSVSRRYGQSVRCVVANALEVAIDEANVTTMQDFGAGVCAKGNDGDTVYLTDARDGKQYRIAKIRNLAGEKSDDGQYLANCWMTQNLALDLETAWNAETMTPALTDVPDEDYFSGIGLATAKNTGFSVSTSNYQAIEYTNATPTVASGTYQSSYGYYYTWCAATVGCKRGTTAGASLTSGDADASICPAGWKLPSGNTNGEWYNLLNGLNMSTIATDPYKIPAAGGMYSSGLGNAGSVGYYWSRTASDAGNAYRLYFDSSYFYPGTNTDNRYVGYSVRCVADPTYTGSSSSNQKDSASASFSIEVKDAITVSNVSFTDADGREVVLSAMPGELVNGKINVNVGSNVKYRITMSSGAPDLASSDPDNTNKIPAITQPMTAEQLKSNYGWGVLAKNSDNQTDATTYTGLDSTNKTFYTSDTPAGAGTETRFNVGVSVPPTLPADTYSTEVTVTTIANE